MTTAAQMLYRAAGQPAVEAVERSISCWWCCQQDEYGVPVATMPSTFLDACGREAGDLESKHLCRACAWTLSDAIRLPPVVGGPLLDRAITGDQPHPGRVSVAIGEESPARRLVWLVQGGIGVWSRPGKQGDEDRWVRQRAALSSDPIDVGPAAYLGCYDRAVLASAVGGKFRNFIPFATASGRWEMWTKADRDRIRGVILNPPDEPWTLSIGDGQKHVAIHGVVSDGRREVQVLHFEGDTVYYRPSYLSTLIGCVEDVLSAGGSRTEIESGQYQERGATYRMVVRRREPVIVRFRGSTLLDLVLFLCRSAKDLRA